ncbi:MAG: hypothetical protein IJR00_05795 [Lachnospiraceae bacterium]|nr:hypothetical protein [Lachnospiraceae bacterium]
MSSRYLEWKYRDVQPEEKRELTKQEKRRNWWHYHKFHVLIGAVLLFIALDLARSALHIGETLPDLSVAYVGAAPLPAECVTAVEETFASFATDANGDGTVKVTLLQYPEGSPENTAAAAEQGAASVALVADLESCDSYLFLLEDPLSFEKKYEILRMKENAPDCYPWTACPKLAALSLGGFREETLGVTFSGENSELLSGLYVARRKFENGREAAHMDACDLFWQTLTEGATKP